MWLANHTMQRMRANPFRSVAVRSSWAAGSQLARPAGESTLNALRMGIVITRMFAQRSRLSSAIASRISDLLLTGCALLAFQRSLPASPGRSRRRAGPLRLRGGRSNAECGVWPSSLRFDVPRRAESEESCRPILTRHRGQSPSGALAGSSAPHSKQIGFSGTRRAIVRFHFVQTRKRREVTEESVTSSIEQQI